MVSKKEMDKLRERNARYYANLPDANFKIPKEISLGNTLVSKAKKYKGFKIN